MKEVIWEGGGGGGGGGNREQMKRGREGEDNMRLNKQIELITVY